MNWENVLTLLLLQSLAVMSPGPDLLVVTQNTIKGGRKKGLFTSLGITTGIGLHLSYIFCGVATFISTTPTAFSLMKYIGCLYLIFLGSKSIVSSKKTQNQYTISSKEKNNISLLDCFKTGFFTNVLNIKCMLFTLSVFSLVMDKSYKAMIVYSAIMFSTTMIWFSFVAYIFSQKNLRPLLIKHTRFVDNVIGISLILLSLKLGFT